MYDFLMYERNGEVLLDPLGTFLPVAIILLIAVAIERMRLPRSLKTVLFGALLFRLVGAMARYIVLFGVYDGSGDARQYYRGGVAYGNLLWDFNFAIFDPANWWRQSWWGTQFVYFPSSLVHSLIGPSMPGGFVIFSLMAFLGLCGFVIAFRRTYPHVETARYAKWVFFFPALWFWPSSIGKEAILLCGLGITVWGYIGSKGRINWALLAIGLFLVFGVRPEVCAVVIASLLIAHWLSLITGQWTLTNTIQAVVLIGLGIGGLFFSLSTIGIEAIGVEGVTNYMENETGRSLEGGSGFDAPEIGLIGIPFALINIFLRPFPWEASGLMPLISSLEILAFWCAVWVRRRNVKLSLRYWRFDPLLRFAIPFIFMYSAALGMMLSNMGIVARQRIFVFPLLFLLFEAVPKRALATRSPAAAPEPRPVPAGRGPLVPSPAIRRG